MPTSTKRKLHGRAFYESLGNPKYILAPMVDQSEFAWRLLSRSFMPHESSSDLLSYTPMFHARMFSDTPKYRDGHFQPLHTTLPTSRPSSPAPGAKAKDEVNETETSLNLDGNPEFDRPLFVQFCANKPAEFLSAARFVAPYCDAVDLNLGCPQGIAKRGGYGAFLQEDWPTISSLISTLHKDLDVPVTAKFRVQETYEKTLEYAKMILSAGASIITVHGRQRHQKGHNTGLADWAAIRYLRDNLPPETVIFANGNILQHADIAACLEATGADGVMSAEGNLYDPSIFAPPPPIGQEGREFFRPPHGGEGGYRMDAVLRRYLDILHRHVLKTSPPTRTPLWMPGEPLPSSSTSKEDEETDGPPPKKKQKRAEAAASDTPKPDRQVSPNLTAVQAHLFHLLRPLVAKHTHIRDTLARTRPGDMEGLERILAMVEGVVADGIAEAVAAAPPAPRQQEEVGDEDPSRSSAAAVARCRRPWFVCQPYVRPLPEEAIEKGAMQVSKKMKRKLEMERKEKEAEEAEKAGLPAGGTVEKVEVGSGEVKDEGAREKVEVPREGLVCG
ncbi:FMN-linked oxidoreductase [Myriangium duriaei CBS 260.36]|uniref:tRNA-dihydrouridine(16/17) synthase [NAD(P)(+)] n=1 Tax=Myriangium duriaei CBS 260.36 TaxID=1168546 RepID=A0A9P4IYF5_9PEZI|nr:FMN-linked oxidoreductase [Myriangium duriaei CBS 260.36]